MLTSKFSFITDEHRHEIVMTLKPALASINNAREYMGNPSRSKFYADILPLLETIKFNENDKRRWVVVASMDRLIDARRTTFGSDEQIQSALDADTSSREAARPALDRQLTDQDSAERRSRRARNISGGRNA
jgi:hypothetical protein